MATENAPQKWAILIGINFHLGREYDNLKGCVNDVNRIESCLLKTQGLQPANITKLTSTAKSDPAATEPVEEEKDWPTYENMKNALEKITQDAAPGDFVYIHYSGHGTQVPTEYPHLKDGPESKDEALVPMDAGKTGLLLRDVKMAWLLSRMVNRGLILTVVFDSCSSAGGVRDPDDPNSNLPGETRGVKIGDQLLSPEEPDVASIAELEAAWKKHQPRGLRVKKNWYLEPYGFEFLAACHSDERALEYAGNSTGVVTFWLLDSLDSSGGEAVTHAMLYRRIYDATNGYNPSQQPVLSGCGERYFFGAAKAEEPPAFKTAIAVTRVPTADKVNGPFIVQLRAGAAHGVCVGAEYAVYRWNAKDLGEPLARAVVTQVGQRASAAQLVGAPVPNWPPGCLAVLVRNPGAPQKAVRLLHRADPSSVVPQRELLDRVAGLEWTRFGDGMTPLRLDATEEGAPADYYIVVNERGEYELLDAAEKPLLNVAPTDSPEAAVGSAAHIAQYHTIRSLESQEQYDMLKHLILEVEHHEPSADGIFDLNNEDKIRVSFTNNCDVAVNVTVFDCGPLWDITQIYPRNSNYETIAKGGRCKLPLAMDLPESLGTAVHTLKAFVTTRSSSFRSLEMPELGSSPAADAAVPLPLPPSPPMEPFVRRPVGDFQANPRLSPDDWRCVEIKIRVTRKGE